MRQRSKWLHSDFARCHSARARQRLAFKSAIGSASRLLAPLLSASAGFFSLLGFRTSPLCIRDALEGHLEGLGNSLQWVIFVECGHGGDGGDERLLCCHCPVKPGKRGELDNRWNFQAV